MNPLTDLIGNIKKESDKVIPQGLSGNREENFFCSLMSHPQYPGLYGELTFILYDFFQFVCY